MALMSCQHQVPVKSIQAQPRISLTSSDMPCTGVKKEIEAVLQRGQANKEGELCVQAIFVLLDVLKQWAEAAQSKASWLVTGQSAAPDGTGITLVRSPLDRDPSRHSCSGASVCIKP